MQAVAEVTITVDQRLRYVVHGRGAIRIAHYDVIDDVITRKL